MDVVADDVRMSGLIADDVPGLIGVLGGMGPLATIDFLRKVLAATPATSDQDHVPVIVSSIPQVPDRTDWIYIVTAALLTEAAAELIRNISDSGLKAQRLNEFVARNLPGMISKAGDFELSAMYRLVEAFHGQRLIETKA